MITTVDQINYVNLSIMIVIFMVTYYLIIKKTFDKTMAGVLGALSTLAVGSLLGVFDQADFLAEELGHDYIILAVLLGNLLMVAVASEIGIFQFVSIKLLKQTRGDPKRLFWTLGTLTFLLSAFVGTIPAILVAGALTFVACNELEFNPKPFIMMEIVITNTGGLTTLISAITNLIIAVPFEIGFLQFFIISAPLAVLLFFVSMYMSKRLFIFPSTDISDEKREKIESYNEWNFVSNPRQFKLTSAIFVGTMLLFLISDIIHFEIAVISVGGGVLMAFSSKKDLDKILPKLDWTLLTFFISLFILIKGLELMGLMILIKKFLLAILGSNVIVGGVLILIFSSVMSGILDNLVLAAALTPVLLDISSESPGLKMGPLVWALIFGTNLGGGLTPIGAPPGVLGLGILYRETGEKVGWGEFFKTIGVITLVRILISAIYVVLIGLLLPDSFTIGIPRPS